MPPKVRAGERLGVNIRDHFLGVGILELEDVLVGNVAEMFIEKLDADAMCSAQVPHSWVFTRPDYLDTRRVILMEDTCVSRWQQNVPKINGRK